MSTGTEGTLGARLAGRRFGLVLSAGYFGFYGHTGFVQGLLGAGLTPAAWAGTSAGGLVAAYAAGGMPPPELEALLLGQTRAAFWDPDPLGAVAALVRRGSAGGTGLLKGERFRQLLERTLPAQSFEALRAPLALVAANLTRGTHDVFTTGPLPARVHATCAYPGLFRAVPLEEGLCWDGGLVDKAPALALADSPAGAGLEALLVHYLPSRAGAPLGGAFAYAQGIATGTAALRREHFRLQLRVLEARGLPVYVVTSELPSVSPGRMAQGRAALEAGRASVVAALGRAPASFV